MNLPPISGSRWVYFIRPIGARGPVKIGYSRDPAARLRQIDNHSPIPLEIAATVEVAARVEGRFHALFVDSYWRGEWFHASARIDRVIAAIMAGTFDLATLPKSVALHLVAKARSAAA